MVAVAIHDHTGHAVTFAPHDARDTRVYATPFAIANRLRDAPEEKIRIQILSLARKAAGDDL